MRPRPFAVAVLCGSALSSVTVRAYAQDGPAPAGPLWLAVEGRTLRVASGRSVAVVDLGCEGRTSLRTENKLFVACGDGVVEVDLSSPLAPRRIGSMSVDGEATGLFVRDGRVWVEIAHVDAQPVRTSAAVPIVISATSEGPPPVAPSPTGDETEPASPAPPKPSLMAPPRRGGLWELSALAGAFINLGPVAGGAMGWASATYRFEAPIVVRAELSPLGVGVGNSQTVNINSTNSSNTVVVAAAHVLVGIDSPFIEVAVGGGGATLGNTFSSAGTPNAGGASIVEEGRFGARDGLALNVQSITVAANNQFQFGSFVMSVQVPLTPKVMLIARGGGGNVGDLFGDLGARVIVQGDGGPDTIALTGFFGGMGFDTQSCSVAQTAPLPPNGLAPLEGGNSCGSTSLGGPSLGGGVEWRR
jgi:hypothetical protein